MSNISDVLSKKKPCRPDGPDRRLEEFRQSFGNLAALDSGVPALHGPHWMVTVHRGLSQFSRRKGRHKKIDVLAAKMGLSPLRRERGQVHVFGRRFFRQTRFPAEKWTSPRPGRERLPGRISRSVDQTGRIRNPSYRTYRWGKGSGFESADAAGRPTPGGIFSSARNRGATQDR